MNTAPKLLYWWHWFWHGIPIMVESLGVYFCKHCRTSWRISP